MLSRAVTLAAVAAVALLAPLSAQKIKLPASLKDLEERARKDSCDAAAHYNVGLAYWNEKRWDDADSAFHRAIRIDPQMAAPYMALYVLPYARRGSLLQEVEEGRIPIEWQKPVEESDRMYRHAVLIDPLVDARLLDVIMPRNALYEEEIKDELGEYGEDYWIGFDMYRAGRFDDAFARFDRVMQQTKGRDLWNTLVYYHGLSAAHTARYDDAVRDFQGLLDRSLQAEKSRKDSTFNVPLRTNEYRYLVAVMLDLNGKPNDAITLYREAAQNDIGLYMAHVRLAAIYETHNMLAQAVRERQEAVNAAPDDPSLLYDLGGTQAKSGDWAGAEKTLEQAAEANPHDARVAYRLGIVKQQLNKPAEAKSAFTRFLAIAPSRYAQVIADAKQRVASLP